MRHVTAGLIILGLAACASTGRTSTAQREVITAQEIQSITVTTAHEAVERLRPQFLRGRGRTSMTSPESQFPVVYVDGVRAGGIEMLRQIRASDVREIRYINAADATTRYGTGHSGGIIDVRIRS